MSKLDFSKKASEEIISKINDLLYLKPDEFFNFDETFYLALSLSYLGLSKEKIISKDMNNKDRLKRLDRKVKEDDINKLFDGSIFKSVPKIIYTKEYDYTWILDNIRDSIMHGTFDMNLDTKELYIKNTWYDRELEVIIPFEWFNEYARYDICKKKVSDRYTIKGFFPNNTKFNRKYFNTKNEILNSIIYQVDITGNKFNNAIIEKRIKELFTNCSKKDISKEMVKEYKDKYKHSYKYSDIYLASFGVSAEIVERIIKEEFPDVELNIRIDDRKYKTAERIEKSKSKSYRDYSILLDELNSSINKKSNNLLKYLTTLICSKGIYNNIGNKPISPIGLMEAFNNIFENYEYLNKDYADTVNKFNTIKTGLLTILLNVYGITTLVINFDDFYKGKYDRTPLTYGMTVKSKQPVINYENRKKELINRLLTKEIKKFEKLQEYKVNPSNNKIKVINKIQSSIDDTNDILDNLGKDMYLEKVYDPNKIDVRTRDYLLNQISNTYKLFDNEDDINIKEILKNTINSLTERLSTIEIEGTMAYIYDMNDTLTIMRNSFSHLGRIYISSNRDLDSLVILNDYNCDNIESGIVTTNIESICTLLQMPLKDDFKLERIKG